MMSLNNSLTAGEFSQANLASSPQQDLSIATKLFEMSSPQTDKLKYL